MDKNVIPMRRIPLSKMENLRDLGGFPCTNGVTRWGVFLRGDNPFELTADDIDTLRRYGVDTEIDLRSSFELAESESALIGKEEFHIYSYSLSEHMNDIDWQNIGKDDLSGLYCALLEQSKELIAQIIRTMIQAKGAAVFHCAVGKDRTGIIAMLLLKAAGVADADIVADYAVTEIYKKDMFDAQVAVFRSKNIPTAILRSIPASMEYTLQYLREEHGTAEKYLKSIGITQQEYDALLEKFVQHYPS